MLSVEGLKTYLHLRRGVLRAVDGINLHVGEGETLGLVGESGCGKTMTLLSILRLLPRAGGYWIEGRVMLDGQNLLDVPEKQMCQIYRGRKISMILQDPLASLNPVYTIGDQVGAPFRYHGLTYSRSEERRAVVDVLKHVRIPSPEQRLKDYPYQFSGGMRQRVAIAMAIACKPRVLLADEPTSSLDVTIQVQIIALFRKIQEEDNVGIILVTHDLGVAADICNRIAVMYAGRVVETGDVRSIYKRPAHPYTRALLNSIPHFGRKKARLYAIEGTPPSLIDPPVGCRFLKRCPHAMPVCKESFPREVEIAPGQKVSCWLASGI
jgi:oligopeptide/dipeptide ABC transporter ATP-binding protein